MTAQARAPRVSVCLPTFNRAGYLEETIASILAQTVTDYELLVADNCSTDATPEVVGRFHDARLRYWRNERNVGHYRNMNRCLERARGAYVCIVHDDDVYTPTFLEREYELLDRHPGVGMVHCAVYVVDAARRPLRVLRAYPRTCVRSGFDEFVRYLAGHNVCCSTVMARRESLAAAGPFEHELMCADWLMWMQLALRGDIGYVAEPLVEMRVHEATMTSSMPPVRWHDEFLEIMDRGLALLATAPDFTGSRRQIERQAVIRQGRRFFVAALAAAARGAEGEASAFVDVLFKLQTRGLPRSYGRAARVLASPVGGIALRPLRRLRRALAAAALPPGARA